jgi:hypothetical protein
MGTAELRAMDVRGRAARDRHDTAQMAPPILEAARRLRR